MENRELKFRCWYNGVMVTVGSLRFYNDGIYVVNDELHVSATNIMQYVGLRDKRGAQVFQGDVLFIYDQIMEVRWTKYSGRFSIFEINNPIYNEEYMINNVVHGEVVGNIYQNPYPIALNPIN